MAELVEVLKVATLLVISIGFSIAIIVAIRAIGQIWKPVHNGEGK